MGDINKAPDWARPAPEEERPVVEGAPDWAASPGVDDLHTPQDVEIIEVPAREGTPISEGSVQEIQGTVRRPAAPRIEPYPGDVEIARSWRGGNPDLALLAQAADFLRERTGEAPATRMPDQVRISPIGYIGGLADAATFGALPAILAGGDRLLMGRDYDEAKADWDRELAYMRGNSPESFLAGQVHGGMATAALPSAGMRAGEAGARALRLGQTGTNIARAAGVTGEVAGMGALSGAGAARTASELPEAALSGATTGAVVDLGLRGLGQIGRAGRSLARGLGTAAAARRASGRLRQAGADLTAMREVQEHFPGGEARLADVLESTGITRPLARSGASLETARQVEKSRLEGILSALGVAGQERSGFVRGPWLDDTVPTLDVPGMERLHAATQAVREEVPQGLRVGASHLADRLMREIVEPTERSLVPQYAQSARGVESFARGLTDDGAQLGRELSIQRLQDTKSEIDRLVYEGMSNNQSVATEHMQRARGVLNREMESAMDDLAQHIDDPQLFRNYLRDKEEWGAAHRAVDWGSDRIRREAANRQMSYGDVVAGMGTTVASGNPVAGLAAVLANRELRSREPALSASYYGLVEKLTRERPDALGQFARPLVEAQSRGRRALQAAYYVLWNREPAFRARVLADDREGEGTYEP